MVNNEENVEVINTPEDAINLPDEETINFLDSYNKLNRAQKRAIKKRMGRKERGQLDIINETSRKLTYIDLIQKARKLNEKKEKNKNEQTIKDWNASI